MCYARALLPFLALNHWTESQEILWTLSGNSGLHSGACFGHCFVCLFVPQDWVNKDLCQARVSFPRFSSLPSTLVAVPPTYEESRMSPGISHLNPNAVRYETTRVSSQRQIQKQPLAKGSVISVTAGSSLMAKQNLFLSGSSINITSRGLKGAESLTGEWLSAIKMQKVACLIFLRRREGGREKDRGCRLQYQFKWT